MSFKNYILLFKYIYIYIYIYILKGNYLDELKFYNYPGVKTYYL